MDIHNSQGEKLEHAVHEADRDDVIVVIGHGVTGDMDRDLIIALADGLQERGWPCVRFSFSGNGNSEGSFEEMCITKEVGDLTAVIDQMKGAKKLAYIGHSMGAAVGALTAAKDDRINVLVSLAGMVHTKTFCEQEFGQEVPGEGSMWEDASYPLTQLFVDDLHAIDCTVPAVKDIRTPWLFVHGDKDDVVLPVDSVELHAVLKGKKKHVVLEGADHCFEMRFEDVVEEIDTWLTLQLK